MIGSIQRFTVGLFLALASLHPAKAEVILQYFETTWPEITRRMPELAEAGYSALWLPPPFKAGNQMSVGFDSFDRFDIGSKDQMGGVRTKYGVEADLLNLMETAHRFGIRVYFDNVMAHNGGPIPGYDENTSIYVQPGFVPEDFHLMRRPDGFFRKMPDYPDWQDEWQVLNRNPFGLDTALELPVNTSFGPTEGSQFPKWVGVRHPDHPEYYLDLDLPIATNHWGERVYTFANKEPFQDTGWTTNGGATYQGAGNGRFDWNDVNGNRQHDAGEAAEPFTDTGLDPSLAARRIAGWGYGNGRYDMGNPVAEDLNAMMLRMVRWFVDKVKADGFRLDAVKHVPYYFFGQVDGDKDPSNWGYNGQIQEQFNVTRGFTDWNNHRDTVFNTEAGRNDAMLFGEHLGAPPSDGPYIASGMRIGNNDLYNDLTGNSGGWGNLTWHDQPGHKTPGVNVSVMYAGSHDFNYISLYDRPTAHALILTRAGLPIIYTDGYNEAQFFNGEKYFPQHGDNAFLGQFNDKHLPNLLHIHHLFARGDQWPKYGDAGYVAYERMDWRETASTNEAAVLAFMAARNGAGWQAKAWQTAFPEGARLINYSFHGGKFGVNVSGGQIKNDANENPGVPAGGYYAFSWRVPEMPAVWDDGINAQIKPIMILQDGQPAPTMQHARQDGYAGDPNFNPYGVSGDTPGDYKYALTIPRITRGTNLGFLARADGSAIDIRLKLDGGMDLNSHMGLGPLSGDRRDHGPGAWDFLLGTESMRRLHRVAEKFAAKNTARNVIGSNGAETYVATIGSSAFTINNGGGVNFDENRSLYWHYHDPADTYQINTNRQFSPPPQSAAGQAINIWSKMGYAPNAHAAWVYYTTNGIDWPEGSAGVGKGNTRVAAMSYQHNGNVDSGMTSQWWRGTLPAMPAGTVVRYKIGVTRLNADDIFPFNATDHSRARVMESLFAITNFNAAAAGYYPHNDYGLYRTGLVEGFHVVRSKPFLNRGGAASIFNQFVQTFYYDTKRPEGQIAFPSADGQDLYGSSYGVVVRGDQTIEDAWFRVTDSDPGNDDASTGANNGNGQWVKASEVTPNLYIQSPHPREWRFDYANIAASNTATIEVRLREVTSSTNMALTDVNGHFTTLTRTVNARGPGFRLYVAWPPADGDLVSEGYVMKAYFSPALADNISSNDLINRFTLRINTNTQPRANYHIIYNDGPGMHSLAFALPNLFNGDPSFQHHIEVDFSRDGYPSLDANRYVRAQPGATPYVMFASPPAADTNGNPFAIVLPDVAAPVATQRQYRIEVQTATNAQAVWIGFDTGTGTVAAVPGNPINTNNLRAWLFTWQFPVTNRADLIEGSFTLRALVDTDGATNTVEAFAVRGTRVMLRETVNNNTNDLDDDDDGINDFNELNATALPTTAYTEWNNGQVHAWYIFGRSDPLSPDSDGDGLPDGLELGWRVPGTNTLAATDTDGDGFPNFRGDLDPPFYNTCDNIDKVPGVSACSSGSKTDLKAGSTTDPRNPDTDFDGLPDGIEDANRNGWVDGDGESIPGDWLPWLDRKWPTGAWSTNWVETDPNNSDTDSDGSSDGFGEDKNFDGRIAGDTNTNRLHDAGEAWIETDPLKRDTDGDGLPDGWEAKYGLDPLDNGTDALWTATPGDGNPVNGSSGDPDGDGFDNLTELLNNTSPQVFDTGTPPPPGDIVIGTGTFVRVGAVTNRNDFTDWTHEHLIALDNYDTVSEDQNGGDVYYRSWASDGLERSRDLVAFYAHDGGAATNGGDDTVYFRVDLHDLQANAEVNGLDVYVVMDTGNTSVGERKILDDVDVLTDMRWEVIVLVDDASNNKVYVNKPGSWDTTTLEDMMVFGVNNVDTRTSSHAFGFRKVHFNARMDAIEFSIHRKALLDAGWAGDFASLNYQVFTTRDNIGNNPRGAGDLDGPDITDIIRSDWFAEDFAGIKDGDKDKLRYDGRVALKVLPQWVGWNADNDRGKRIKLVPLVHSAQAIQPGSYVQNLVNNGAGAGYYRPFDVHQAYGVPLTLHVTPTLASAIQWANARSNAPAYKDGPALNARIRQLAVSNLVQVLGSTFSDHLMPYFTPEFNCDNVHLARETLAGIYGAGVVSTQTFFTPERLLDHDVLAKIVQLGYRATFIDQSQHLRRWFGMPASQGDDAYRINTINGVDCFVIHDRYNTYRFETHDGGPSIAMREILNRRARTGSWDGQHPQVVTLFYNWEEFGDKTTADRYDTVMGWMASRAWIDIVTPDQIMRQELDISLPPNGGGDAWNRVNRGAGLTLAKTAHDWLQYGAQDNVDNWYMGSTLNQGLYSNRFLIRTGVQMNVRYGMIYFGGVVSQAWDRVRQLDTNATIGRLARKALHASVFLSAFHNQTQNPVNMTKFSTGDWAYPDNSVDTLAPFARVAQAQTRMAALYQRVATWASFGGGLTAPQTEIADVDLDGENEYLLYNDRVFALFERIGGRMTGAWVRDILDGSVYQALGNFASYAGSESEEEGNLRVTGTGTVIAHRTSGLKDWWVGTNAYVNMLYTFTDWTNGWRIVSTNGLVAKTITLPPGSGRFDVRYQASGALAGRAFYVRHGLSPNLGDLVVAGQKTLGSERHEAGRVTLENTNYATTVAAYVDYARDGYNATFNFLARDDDPDIGVNFTTRLMRNQAQTHQVEVYGTNDFRFGLGFMAYPSDWNGDGLPNDWVDEYLTGQTGETGPDDDPDNDTFTNLQEWIAGTHPMNGGSFPFMREASSGTSGILLRFPTAAARLYHVWYANASLLDPAWSRATTAAIAGTGGVVEWLDDGSQTAPSPANVTNRYYKIEVSLP